MNQPTNFVAKFLIAALTISALSSCVARPRPIVRNYNANQRQDRRNDRQDNRNDRQDNRNDRQDNRNDRRW